MTLSHAPIKPFRPTGKGGGSKIGKPQGSWPWLIKILAEAVCVRAAGSFEALEKGVMNLAVGGETEDVALERLMNSLAPGWLEWAEQNMVKVKTRRATLLRNRVYKACGYCGSSALGAGATPVRAKSPEHWSYRFPETHKYYEIYQNVVRGRVVSLANWQELLPLEASMLKKPRRKR